MDKVRSYDAFMSYSNLIKILLISANDIGLERNREFQIIGVSNGLCEHLRACEQCVYFCEHEQ